MNEYGWARSDVRRQEEAGGDSMGTSFIYDLCCCYHHDHDLLWYSSVPGIPTYYLLSFRLGCAGDVWGVGKQDSETSESMQYSRSVMGAVDKMWSKTLSLPLLAPVGRSVRLRPGSERARLGSSSRPAKIQIQTSMVRRKNT